MKAKFINEALEDTFKPKNIKEIIDSLKEKEDVEEFELFDGSKIWVYEDGLRDMGGEWSAFLSYVDESGKIGFMEKDIINKVIDPTSRQELYNWAERLY